MSEKKPIPPSLPPKGKVCPVCGKQTYSLGGIHPQCAMRLADAPRVEKLKVDRRKDADEIKRGAWSKTCARCGRELHARRKVCDCGHVFF